MNKKSIVVDTGRVRVFDAKRPEMIVEVQSGIGDGLYDVAKGPRAGGGGEDGDEIVVAFADGPGRWSHLGFLEVSSGRLVFTDPCHDGSPDKHAKVRVRAGRYVVEQALPTRTNPVMKMFGRVPLALRLTRVVSS